MTRRTAIIPIIIVLLCGALTACGSDGSAGSQDTPVPQPALSQEMLEQMIPGISDLPGFTRSDARFLDNQGASSNADDPAARVAHLDEIGRIVGFHAVFGANVQAPADAPDTITWSVNLFKAHDGAVEFINEPIDSEGVVVESLDVSSLGAEAVGYVVRNADPTKAAMGYVVAFTEANVEAGITASYPSGSTSPDYVLGLAQQAQTMVKSVINGGAAAQPSPAS